MAGDEKVSTADEGRDRRPTLNQLEALVAVVKHGSYAKAGREAYPEISSSLLWRTVDRLQTSLGIDLVKTARGERAVTPTRAGEVLYEEAQLVLQAAERFVTRATDVRAGKFRVIRLGCAPAQIGAGVADALRVFTSANENVRIQLTHVVDDQHGGGDGLFAALVQGEVDLVIAPARSVDLDHFLEQPFYRWWLVALPHSAEEMADAPLSVDELRGRPLLLRSIHFTSRKIVDLECRRAGFEPRVEYQTPSADALLWMWRAGLGTAVLPHDVLPEGVVDALRPVVTYTNDSLGRLHAMYARRRDVEEDEDLASFIDQLVEAGSEAHSPAAERLERIAKAHRIGGTFVSHGNYDPNSG